MAEPMVIEHERKQAKSLQEKEEENEMLHEEFLEEFHQKDSILEPKVLKTLEKFLQIGGTLEEAVDIMVASFVDLPASINKMIEFLTISGMKKKDITALVEEHLKDLVLKHFDPRKADRIFAEAGSAPQWLEEIVGYAAWRNLIYQLSEQFPECILLKFAMKLISDAGYQNEITSATTASKDFDVFVSLFSSHLNGLVGATKPHLFQSHLNDILKLTCHTEHTYVYTQAVLCVLEERFPESKPLLRWLSQEMEKEAVGKIQETLKWTLLLRGVTVYPQLFEALNSMLTRNALNPADMTTVYQHYTEMEHTPPSEFLRIPHFLELLLVSLFKTGSTVNPTHEEKYIYVLAYATSVWDRASETFSDVLEPVLDELTETQVAVSHAYTICRKGSVSHTDLQSSVQELYQTLQYPVVSKAVLLWLEGILLEGTFFEMAVENAILYFSILDEIAECHKLHHPQLMSLLKRLYETSSPSTGTTDLDQKIIVDRMLHLAFCGHAVPVIEHLSLCMSQGSMDHSLIRYFVHELLSAIGPPYSSDFVSALTPILGNSESLRSSSTEGRDLVAKFLEDTSKKIKRRKR